MRPRRNIVRLSSLITLPYLASAVTFDCQHALVDGQNFDLSYLKGPHNVHWTQDQPIGVSNYTFTLDICASLAKKKGVSTENQCPHGTRVCGIERKDGPDGGTDVVVVPIAGNFEHEGGYLDPYLTRLKHSKSNADAEKEGLRVELNGGRYPFRDRKGRQQKALIEFLCDADRTGLEGVEDDTSEKVDRNDEEDAEKRRRDDDTDEDDGKSDDSSLKFISYKTEEDGKKEAGVLRLEWRTKYACEGQKRDDSGDKSEHWGFFTWFIIILFLAVAGYLIFGSWLNYNRYGARGWDLVPHGDTIRDIPYVLKDWGRSAVNAVQGPGSRGGYSAV